MNPPHPTPQPPACAPLAQAATLTTVSLIALPWLNPFTSGPNSTVLPVLVSWACMAALLLWWSALAITPQQRLRSVALAWATAACASAVLGLLQYFDISHDWAPWVNQPGLGQAFGNLRQRNQFATLCSMGLAALWWWAQQVGPVPGQSRWRALGLVALAALLGAGAAASGSRTGLLQLLLLLLLGAWWTWGRRAVPLPPVPGRWLFAAALLAYGVAALALPRLAGIEASVFDRLHESSAQCASRLNLWRNVLYLIAQKPLWGWGWGELDYAHFITLYDAPWAGLRFCEILDNAHNLPLHLAVELGLPVALLLCGAVVGWLVRHRPWCELRPERQLAWAVLAVIGVHSLLEYPLWYGQFQAAGLLALWLLRRFPGGDKGRPRIDTDTGAAGAAAAPTEASLAPRRWGWPAPLAGAAIALACAGAGWSYWRVSQPYLPPAERAAPFRSQSWAQLRDTWLFSDQVDFAELAVTPVTPVNAAHIFALATGVLHFSPEPMVVQKLLQSAQMQGKDEEVAFYARRLEVAFPDAYAQWVKGR